MKFTWQQVVLALAFPLFAFGVLWLGLDHASSFSTVWAALGSVVGVFTGAIPAYFFKQQADTATKKADNAAAQITIYAEQLAPDAVEEVHKLLAVRGLVKTATSVGGPGTPAAPGGTPNV